MEFQHNATLSSNLSLLCPCTHTYIELSIHSPGRESSFRRAEYKPRLCAPYFRELIDVCKSRMSDTNSIFVDIFSSNHKFLCSCAETALSITYLFIYGIFIDAVRVYSVERQDE
jgi:hypothetical protein